MTVLPSAAFSVLSLDDSAGTVRDLKTLVRSVEISEDSGLVDITSASADSRVYAKGISDFTVTLTGFVSFGSNEVYDVLIGNTDGVRTFTGTIQGKTFAGEFILGPVSMTKPEGDNTAFRAELRPASGTPSWS